VIWPFGSKKNEQGEEEEEDTIYQKIFAPSTLTKVEQVVGAIMSGLTPKMCLNCGEVTSFESELHHTWYSYKHLGYYKISPLCQKCWDGLSKEDRLVLYRKNFNVVIDYSRELGESPLTNFKWEEVWNEIEKSVRRGR